MEFPYGVHQFRIAADAREAFDAATTYQSPTANSSHMKSRCISASQQLNVDKLCK
jgi:hypothetical protein